MGTLRRDQDALRGHTIGVYGSGGAPWHHLALAAAHGAEVRGVRAEDVRNGRLAALDAFVMPGGGAAAMPGLLAPLGEEGVAAIRRWVENGGTYVSSCAGSVLPLALTDAADAAMPLARLLRMVDVPLANPGDETLGGLASPGVGRIEVRLDTDHPFARGLPKRIPMIHYNGPLFDLRDAPDAVRPFAWPTRATDAFTPAERFLPSEAGNDTVLDRSIAIGAATALDAPFGRGRTILFGSHPEFGLGPLGLGWGDGAALLVAALRGRADAPPRTGGGRPGSPGWAVRHEHSGTAAPDLALEAAAELHRAAARFERIAAADPGAWLAPEIAPAFHGREPRSAWSEDGRAAAVALSATGNDLEALAHGLVPRDLRWLDDLPRHDQDFGAMGLLQQARRIHAMLDGAERAMLEAPRLPAHAYDLFDSHPYHLAVGSYLSAAGLAAAALLTVVVLASGRSVTATEADRLAWGRPGGERVA